jgi:DNA processing protein
MATHRPISEARAERYMEKRSNPRDRGYQPPQPEAVHIVTVGDLLNGKREIVANQQARLGYEAEGLDLQVWCAGDRSLVQKRAMAIVGTRNVSPNGAARARRLARELSEEGIIVFSGLAKGIDTEALQSAMHVGGRVVAVIGTPIDKAYPAENKRLQEEIYREHLLISQFYPGQRVFPSHFPERNKLMAALSDGTVIIEAGETSGTLHQAAECVRLGRWLFISQSVMDDPILSWPRRFEEYEKFRVLRETKDLLSAFDTARYEPPQH